MFASRKRDGLSWPNVLVVLGFWYIAAYMLAYWLLPGHAFEGRASDGHYYLRFHGIYVEVSQQISVLSRLAGLGVPVAVVAILVGATRRGRKTRFGATPGDDAVVPQGCVSESGFGGFSVVAHIKEDTSFALLFVPAAVFLSLLATAFVYGTVRATLTPKLDQPLMFGLIASFSTVLATAAFVWMALRSTVGMTTRVMVGKDRIVVFQGFKRIGVSSSLRFVGVPSIVMLDNRIGSPLEIRDNNRAIRFGRFLPPPQKSFVLHALQSVFAEVGGV